MISLTSKKKKKKKRSKDKTKGTPVIYGVKTR